MSSFALTAFRRAKDIAKRFPLDLITTQSPLGDGLIGCLLKWRLQAPLLVQLHFSRPGDPAWLRESPGNYFRLLVARWVMRQADGVRVYTEDTSRWLTETWDIPHERIYVNPISPVRLVPDPSVQKSEHPTVLYVGRLAPEKGVDVLLEAFTDVAVHLPEAHLLIVGDGPERSALQSLASSLKLNEEKVTFVGAVTPDSLLPHYQRAWVVALPSRHESYGRVILEAFASGCPVVATATEGARSLIRNAIDGFIVPRENVSALAERLLFLLRNPGVAEKMGIQGQAATERQGNVQQLRRDLVSIFLTVAKRGQVCGC